MDTPQRSIGLRNNADLDVIIKKFCEVAKGHYYEDIINERMMYIYLSRMDIAKKIYTWYDAKGHLQGILIYDVMHGDWYTMDIIVKEVLVLAIDDSFKGLQREAIKTLEDIAEYYQAKYIVSGNYLSQGATAKMVENCYKKHGFQGEYKTFLRKREEA